jgi:hypothetical protein
MSQSGIDLKALKQLEWETELEQACLIQSNVNKLLETPSDMGILIISDTYYSSAKLEELLTHLNFPRLRDITIYTSRSGKEDGWIWPLLAGSYNILRHTGDNKKSDVSIPLASKAVQQAVHSAMAHSATAAETLMFIMGRRLGLDISAPEMKMASLMRRLSLANPYDFVVDRERFFWHRLHASYTLPLYWFFIHSVKNVLHANPQITRITAMSRDCILLEPLIERFLLGGRGMLSEKDGTERHVDVVRLDASRALLVSQLKNPNLDYIAYLRETLGDCSKCLVIDINGTYRSLSELTRKEFGEVPLAHFLSIQNGGVLTPLRGILTVAIPGIDTNILEKMCAVPWGSLVDWIGRRGELFGGPVRVPCENKQVAIDVTRRMFTDIAPPILEKYGPDVMPRVRVMATLLQKATNSAGGELEHVNRPVTLASLIVQGTTLESKRQLELATLYSRILSYYHDLSPTICDMSSSRYLTMPWVEYMRGRATMVKKSEKACIVNLTATNDDHATTLFDEYWPVTSWIMAVYVFQSEGTWKPQEGQYVVWPLVTGGVLYAIYRISHRKAEPVIDVDDLPEVPSHHTRL